MCPSSLSFLVSRPSGPGDVDIAGQDSEISSGVMGVQRASRVWEREASIPGVSLEGVSMTFRQYSSITSRSGRMDSSGPLRMDLIQRPWCLGQFLCVVLYFMRLSSLLFLGWGPWVSTWLLTKGAINSRNISESWKQISSLLLLLLTRSLSCVC